MRKMSARENSLTLSQSQDLIGNFSYYLPYNSYDASPEFGIGSTNRKLVYKTLIGQTLSCNHIVGQIQNILFFFTLNAAVTPIQE